MYFSEEFSLAPCEGNPKKDLTEAVFQKRSNPQFSEEGSWLASLASGNRVVIRDSETLSVKGIFPAKQPTTTATQQKKVNTNKENAPSSSRPNPTSSSRSIPPPSTRSVPSSRTSLSSRPSLSSRSKGVSSLKPGEKKGTGGGVGETKMGKVDEYVISPDEKHLLLVSYTDDKCQVWSIEDKKLICHIDEHNLGISHARWTPDSKHVMIISDFCLRTTVYSLISGGAIFLPGPKYASTGFIFVEDGECFAVLERENYKDVVALYRCDTWDIITKFETQTDDAVSIHSALNDTSLVVIDTRLTYKLKIFDFEGNDIGTFSAYSDALGIRSLSFDNRGQQYVALGSYDSVLRVLHLPTNTCITSLPHSRSSLLSSLHVYRLNSSSTAPPVPSVSSTPSRWNKVENTPKSKGGRERGVGGAGRKLFGEQQTPKKRENFSRFSSSRAPPPSPSPSLSNSFSLSFSEDAGDVGGVEEMFLVVDGAKERESLVKNLKSIPLDPNNPNHAEGVKFCEWSKCGGYVATVVENFPQIIWIWEVTSFTLHSTLILSKRVKQLIWHPSLALLLSVSLSSSSSPSPSPSPSLYLWSPHHCSCVEIPEDEEKEKEREEERRRGGAREEKEKVVVGGLGFSETGESVWVGGKRGKKFFYCVLFVRPLELDFLQIGEDEMEGERGEEEESEEEFDETIFDE